MPFPNSSPIDPSQVLLFPWMWKEISHDEAMLLAPFIPVVTVRNSSFGFATDVFSLNWQLTGHMFTDPFSPVRYFKQVGFAPTAAASPVAKTMSFSDDGVEFLGKGYENPQEKGWDKTKQLYFSYDDGYGFPTIGYGHLIKKGEDFSKGLTKAQNIELFKKDANKFVKAVNGKLKKGVTQQQFDALVILQFNLGVGVTTQPTKQINAGVAVKEADFTKYTHVKGTPAGKVNKGLLTRRKGEWKIFSKGVYDARH